MSNKADVKAIMARFQASGASTDESTSPARPKPPLQPTLSGPAIQKKHITESLSSSGSTMPPKPFLLKNTPSSTIDTDTREINKTKALASKFAIPQDDVNKSPVVSKLKTSSKPPFLPTTEAKEPPQKPFVNKPFQNSASSEPKPVFPKPLGVVNSKPSWLKEDNSGCTASSTTAPPPKAMNLPQRPNVLKLIHQNEEQIDMKTDTVNKTTPSINIGPKPPSNFITVQNKFNKEKDLAEETESSGLYKVSPANTTPPLKPPASKKPSLKRPTNVQSQANGIIGDPSAPKRNPLPNSLALGPAPAKPNRPPKVDLENIKTGPEASADAFKKLSFPPPLPPNISTSSSRVSPTLPPQPALPSLPPRHPVTTIQDEDFYDDVDKVSPPPLPSITGHPSQRPKEDIEDDDGEMYEDLDERWEQKSQEMKKDEKEDKKRLEAAKKEQKEREKKEQDARKKFKLTGLVEVIQRGKAVTDCKGTKTDLALKQGEQLDIIRVQGNPEGKWLARTQDGSIGYVKTTLVEIDFNSLKNTPAQTEHELEVYDDIDVVPADNRSNKGPGVVLPPIPGEEGEIYDDVVDPSLEVSSLQPGPSPARNRSFLRMFDRNRRAASSKVVPPPSQFTAEANSDQPGAVVTEDIYDDVDSQNLVAPAPPPISSLPGLKSRLKTEEIDPKKQKRFEKEEKEFRKKFKHEGEIQVLFQVTIIPTLTNKKWNSKELPVKAGEKLDVIVKAQDNKLICRNDDGKFGYVSTSHILDDGEIYDDIGGDDCIYDND